jgi:hypothetical protein
MVIASTMEQRPKSAMQARREGVTRTLIYDCSSDTYLHLEELGTYRFQVPMHYIFFVQILKANRNIQDLGRYWMGKIL